MSFRDRLGPDYPAYLTDRDGTRLPLEREGRWRRSYRHPTTNRLHVISRVLDGSATISANELREQWPAWTPAERRSFIGEVSGLRSRADFSETLHFLIELADAATWSTIATSVARSLPQDEAFRLLSDSLDGSRPPESANIVHALALTRHPSAAEVIRIHFEKLWAAPQMWQVDPLLNPWAFVATGCIQHLVGLGASPSTFEESVRALSRHRCARNRQIASAYLGAHYPWLLVSEAEGPA